MFKNFNLKIENFFLTFLFFLLSIILINSSFVSSFIWKLPIIFQDLKTIIKWLECHNLGINLYELNNCIEMDFVYGKILLLLPFNESFYFFYTKILPYILIYFSIYYVVKLIQVNNLKTLILLTLTIINPSTFLLFERANIDLLIFVIFMFSFYNRIYFINWFLYFYLTFFKIYPIILFLNIFLEKKRSIRNIASIFLFIFVISLIYLSYNFQDYFYQLNNLNSAKAGYHYLFSLNSFAKILKYKFQINYILLILITYSTFIYLVLKLNKKIIIILNKDLISKVENSIEFKIFITSSVLIIFCYFIFSNIFYREIFLSGIIPLILKLQRFDKKNTIFKIIINLFLIKLIYSFIYAYFNVNDQIVYVDGQRIFSNIFLLAISIKSLIDFILMIIISALSIHFVTFLIKSSILFKRK